MEEFASQENRKLYDALTNEKEYTIEWPDECRNCEYRYSVRVRSQVIERFLTHPVIDFLWVVSRVIEEENPGRYCCINNFHPVIRKNPRAGEENGICYHVLTESFAVEEGLYEWYAPIWSIDDVDMSKEVELELVKTTPDVQFSLFNIIDSTLT